MSTLDVIREQHDGQIYIRLAGELDIASAPTLETELRQVENGAPATIVLDLRTLEFLDSTGLRIIIEADSRAREAGRRVVIVRGPAAVQRVLAVTRLDERLELVDDPATVA